MDDLLGLKLQPHELGYGQIVLRALIVFIGSLIIVRLGAKRFLGRKTIFDFILAPTRLCGEVMGRSPEFLNKGGRGRPSALRGRDRSRNEGSEGGQLGVP